MLEPKEVNLSPMPKTWILDLDGTIVVHDGPYILGHDKFLPGAKEFLDELRSFSQVILISDTFTQFATPLMEKLGRPTLFCNSLEVAENGEITGFKMRCEKSKLTTVKALQSMGFETIASGDSYNDLGMIQASKAGFLFRSTEQIRADHPEIPAYEEYDELLAAIREAMK